MKRLLFFIAVVTILFISCTGFFDLREEVEIVGLSQDKGEGQVVSKTKTNLIFVNKANRFPVDVFSDHTRKVRVNHSTIPAYQNSVPIDWLPTKSKEEFDFYLTYYLPVVDDFAIPFIPQKWNFHFIPTNVPFEVTTEVTIYNLLLIPNDIPLIDDVGIIIENNFAAAATLFRSRSGVDTAVDPLNITGVSSINQNKKGFYRVPAVASAPPYKIRTNIYLDLPSGITRFTAGNLYIIEVTETNTLKLKDSYPMTINKF